MKKVKLLITPLTVASFIIVAVTGVMMFFKLRAGIITPAHEWLGIVFVVMGILHMLLLHKNSMKKHLSKPGSAAVIVAGLLITVLSVSIPGRGASGMPPFLKAENIMYEADLNTLPPLFELSDQEFMQKLAASGLTVLESDTSLQSIAIHNNLTRKEIMARVTSIPN
ncbi:DUF4405 domain-containing protein [Spongorhabdus nitratireducens]